MGGGISRDEHGQLAAGAVRRCGREDRTVHEIIGIARGLIADGVVNQMEAEFLRQWLDENMHHAVDVWPVNVINRRIREVFADGVVDAEERAALLEVLSQCVGGAAVVKNAGSLSTTLPLDNPAPVVEFSSHTFCFTGEFAFGTRRSCMQQVEERGGLVIDTVSKKLDYLVIGLIGSRDWLHSTHGTKIRKAVEYRDKGRGLAIVGEDHWANHLG